jgi:hypothetical protein
MDAEKQSVFNTQDRMFDPRSRTWGLNIRHLFDVYLEWKPSSAQYSNKDTAEPDSSTPDTSSPPLITIHSLVHSAPNYTTYVPKIHLLLGLPNGYSPRDLPINLHTNSLCSPSKPHLQSIYASSISLSYQYWRDDLNTPGNFSYSNILICQLISDSSMLLFLSSLISSTSVTWRYSVEWLDDFK